MRIYYIKYCEYKYNNIVPNLILLGCSICIRSACSHTSYSAMYASYKFIHVTELGSSADCERLQLTDMDECLTAFCTDISL